MSYLAIEFLQFSAREDVPLPAEVDFRIIAVFRLARVTPGECAEEGIGQKTGYLLLRKSQRVVHPCLK